MTVDRPLTDLRNIGAVSARRLAAVGIASGNDMRAVGAVAAYRRVRHSEPRHTSLNLLYALEGALTVRRWQRLSEPTKARLRREAGA